MEKIFVIGGMGAGKSTAVQALVDQGIPAIDLDQIGHEVHSWPIVKEELVEAFGPEVLDAQGDVDRREVAARAFVDPASTRKLNRITMPRIEDAFRTKMDELEAAGTDAVVVEYSVFKTRFASLAYIADVVVAILAPLDLRIQRAVASGFEEDDVRRRIAQQITDEERAEAADVVFVNDRSKQELYDQVKAWYLNHDRATSVAC